MRCEAVGKCRTDICAALSIGADGSVRGGKYGQFHCGMRRRFAAYLSAFDLLDESSLKRPLRPGGALEGDRHRYFYRPRPRLCQQPVMAAVQFTASSGYMANADISLIIILQVLGQELGASRLNDPDMVDLPNGGVRPRKQYPLTMMNIGRNIRKIGHRPLACQTIIPYR